MLGIGWRDIESSCGRHRCCVQAGQIKVLFVSPERLGNPHLLDALQPHMPLPLVSQHTLQWMISPPCCCHVRCANPSTCFTLRTCARIAALVAIGCTLSIIPVVQLE